MSVLEGWTCEFYRSAPQQNQHLSSKVDYMSIIVFWTSKLNKNIQYIKFKGNNSNKANK